MAGINLDEFELNENRKRVYIAGPYTHGDWGENQRNVIEAAQKVMNHGHVPFIPHTMTGLWSVMYSNNWIAFDLHWLKTCDAIVRLPGESEGADIEVAFAKQEGIKVYDSVERFIWGVDDIE